MLLWNANNLSETLISNMRIDRLRDVESRRIKYCTQVLVELEIRL